MFCSGFLTTEKQVYLIEPLEESVDGNHAIFKQEHLRVKQGTFGYINDTVYDLGPRFSGLYKGRNMVIIKILCNLLNLPILHSICILVVVFYCICNLHSSLNSSKLCTIFFFYKYQFYIHSFIFVTQKNKAPIGGQRIVEMVLVVDHEEVSVVFFGKFFSVFYNKNKIKCLYIYTFSSVQELWKCEEN